MRSNLALCEPVTPKEVETSRRQRVLIVEEDLKTLRLLTELLRCDPAHFEPLGVTSAEEALERLATEEDLGCLLAEIDPASIDGLLLLHSARKLKPDLKVVLMTSAPTDDLHREAVQSGAIRLLTTPLDLEDLLFSLSAERKGALSYLEGDLDVTDICTLLAACQASGGVRLRQGERAGSLVLRGATLIHAATEELTGAAALDRLRGWGNWYFESLSAFETAHLPVNCGLEITGGSAPREEVKAFGTLRGLALHHLLEWAISRQETCLLTVTAGAKTGVLRFEDGRVRSAETPEREGGRAAAEILSWDNVRVQLTRPQTAEWSTAVNTEAVQALIDRFSDEVEGIIATCVVRRDGSPIAGRSLEPELDFARAAGRYAKVLESHFAAVEDLGVGLTWGRTEDLVITLGGAYLLVRLLGHRHYHWLLVSNESNLAFCRLRMQGYAGPLAQSLEDVGEILSASLPAV